MKYTKLVNNWMSTWRQYPIALLGYDIRKWENQTYDYLIGDLIKKFVFFRSYPDKGPTHLQKQSPFGFLIQWPLCFHLWYQFRPQQTRVGDGGVVVTVPGSEVVVYGRLGWARWDAEDNKYIVWKCGFGTLYVSPTHWD